MQKASIKLGPMPIRFMVILYVGVLSYAATMYFLGPLIPIATIVVGFGFLIIPYLLFEWVATPIAACLMGFQARWSAATAAIGFPLVVLFTAATPVVDSGSEFLFVPVPWLAVYEKSKSAFLPLIHERLVWWIALYAFSLGAGLLSRHLRPPLDTNGVRAKRGVRF